MDVSYYGASFLCIRNPIMADQPKEGKTRARRRGGWEREVAVLRHKKWCAACSRGWWRGRGESLRGRIKLAKERKWVLLAEGGKKRGRQEKEELIRKEQQKGEQLGHWERHFGRMEEPHSHFHHTIRLFLFPLFSSSLRSPQKTGNKFVSGVYFWMPLWEWRKPGQNSQCQRLTQKR